MYSLSRLITKIEYQMGFKSKVKWINVFMIVTFHVVGFIWIYLYAFPAKWQTVLFGYISYVISGAGITCGVHRLWTHRCYKARLPLRIYLMLTFASTGQNTIYNWVRDHRLHHKFSDTEADPHNVKRGFFYSHMGWLMMEKSQLVREKGKLIDMSDILQDPVAMFQRKLYLVLAIIWYYNQSHIYSGCLKILFAMIIPVLMGTLLLGETWKCAVAWFFFARILTVFHAEMTVNSLAHIFGNRPYNKNIRPTQNLFVSAVAGGEGFHNYHHMFPNDYKAAEGYEIPNYSTQFIRLWAKMGLAYDLKEPTPQLIQAVISHHADQTLNIDKQFTRFESTINSTEEKKSRE